MLILLGFVLLLGGGSIVYLAQGVGVADAVMRCAPRLQPQDQPQMLGTSFTTAKWDVQWNRTYGGSGRDEAYAVIQTADGGFALAGVTSSYSWMVKTDVRGTMEWQHTYGGAGAQAVIQTTDGGFTLTKSRERGSGLVKTDAHGAVEWTQTYGGSEDDNAYAGIQTVDGGYTLAGYTESSGAGGRDGWLVKTIPSEVTPPQFSVPTTTVVSPNGGKVWQGMQTITWTATDPQADPLTYTVYYSPNGGNTWTQLATGLIEPLYLWDTTTMVDGANYLIRVEATDGKLTEMDVSNRPFEIANEAPNTAPTVLVIRPNGGERARDMFEIQWQATDPDGDPLTYTLSYSPNGGDTWTQIASEVTGTSYQWDTSSVQVSENYLIKIEASDGRLTGEDRSDYIFTVEREAPTETRSEAFFVPSFRILEVLGALFALLALGKRQRRRKKLMGRL